MVPGLCFTLFLCNVVAPVMKANLYEYKINKRPLAVSYNLQAGHADTCDICTKYYVSWKGLVIYEPKWKAAELLRW